MKEIIDVHTHCFTSRGNAGRVREGLKGLKARGLSRMVTVGQVNEHLDEERAWGLIPPQVAERNGSNLYEVEDLLAISEEVKPAIIPFVDLRHFIGEVAPALDGWMAQGFKGLKGIYLPDEGNDLGTRGIPETLGISLAAYQRREWEIFDYANANDLPLLYHLDAKRYGGFLEELLADFPSVRVNVPHLGVSRKAFAGILDRHENVFTDIAFLAEHMKKDLKGYGEFIAHYADRVCFGTDAFLHSLEAVADYIDVVEALKLPPRAEEALFSSNPRRYLKL